MTVTIPDTISPGGAFPVAMSPDIGRSNGSTVEATLLKTEADAIPTQELLGKVRPLRSETGTNGARWRIGNRLFVTLDTVSGLFPRKLTVPSTAKLEDGSSLTKRLVGTNAGDKIKALAAELGPASIRWRAGNRLLMTLDVARGLYPRRATLPASTKVDDDLSTSLALRLVAAGVGALLKRLPIEAGGVVRVRWGNRLLGQWTKAGGFMWSRQTLPADCKLADQPGVNLIDRLSGSGRGAAVTANYIAIASADAAGKTQISVRRRADGMRFQITSGASSARAPLLTSDDKVLFDSDATGRMMYAPATGGTIWPVDPYDVIDAYGDSLTASAGSTGGRTFPKVLADMLGSVVSTVNNRGVGGQISADIAARQGSMPALISVTDNVIPASGPVTVTAYSQDLLYGSGVSGVLTLTGTLAGIPGTLSGNAQTGRNTATYIFTRTTPGDAVPCAAKTAFIPDFGTASRPRVQLFTYGRNDGTSQTATNNILAALAASVAYQTAYLPRFLVGGVLAQPGEALGPFNTLRDTIAAAYPGRFVDLNAAPTAEEMAKVGFVPDSYGTYSNGRTDAQDLAAGYVPSGMRTGATTGSGDFLHMNNFGYALWALRYYRKIVSMGWWPTLPLL